MKDKELLNVGFGNYAVARHVIFIANPGGAPMRRTRNEALTDKRLIDATQGRKTRSIIVTSSNHVILSSLQADTLAQRFIADQ